MRTYIIGNDGIALCREAPATVSDGEIVVTSKEELRAAPLNGKRLLALWNALPGVDKRRKVGDRAVLIDQLWSAIEAHSAPALKLNFLSHDTLKSRDLALSCRFYEEFLASRSFRQARFECLYSRIRLGGDWYGG
jgi:hypothetical protein